MSRFQADKRNRPIFRCQRRCSACFSELSPPYHTYTRANPIHLPRPPNYADVVHTLQHYRQQRAVSSSATGCRLPVCSPRCALTWHCLSRMLRRVCGVEFDQRIGS